MFSQLSYFTLTQAIRNYTVTYLTDKHYMFVFQIRFILLILKYILKKRCDLFESSSMMNLFRKVCCGHSAKLMLLTLPNYTICCDVYYKMCFSYSYNSNF